MIFFTALTFHSISATTFHFRYNIYSGQMPARQKPSIAERAP
jgi:hypothetical protein